MHTTTLQYRHIRAQPRSVYEAMQGRMRWIAAAEIAAMSLLILSYIWIWQRAFPGAFLLCVAGYFGIGILGHRARGESLQTIGVRLDNWRPALRNASIVVVLAVSSTLLIGSMMESWHFPPWQTIAVQLPVTIVWATAQQYGLLCVFLRRSQDVFGNFVLALGSAALFFALFHLPNSFLVGVTLAAGAVAGLLYRFQPNILIIGVAHALISFTLIYSLPRDVTMNLRVGPGYYRALTAEDGPNPLKIPPPSIKLGDETEPLHTSP